MLPVVTPVAQSLEVVHGITAAFLPRSDVMHRHTVIRAAYLADTPHPSQKPRSELQPLRRDVERIDSLGRLDPRMARAPRCGGLHESTTAGVGAGLTGTYGHDKGAPPSCPISPIPKNSTGRPETGSSSRFYTSLSYCPLKINIGGIDICE